MTCIGRTGGGWATSCRPEGLPCTRSVRLALPRNGWPRPRVDGGSPLIFFYQTALRRVAFVPAWTESRAGGRAGVGEQEGGRAGGRVVKRTELERPRSATPKGQPGVGSGWVTYGLRAWYRGTGVVDADGGARGGVSLASRWCHRGGVLVAGGTATGLAAGGMPGCH